MRSNAKDRQSTSSVDCSEVGTVGLITEQRAAGRPNPRETAQCNKREMTLHRAKQASKGNAGVSSTGLKEITARQATRINPSLTVAGWRVAEEVETS
jgi:hypothetical protein